MSAPIKESELKESDEIEIVNLDKLLLSDYKVPTYETKKESKGSSGSTDKGKRSNSVPSHVVVT
jgi:hypothetical protein